MELSKQVVSLDLARRLKELGVKQDSLFYWVEIIGKGKTVLSYREEDTFVPPNIAYSAFTVAELGEMLSDKIGVWPVKHTDGFWAVDMYIQDKRTEHIIAITEADARAKMLIHLLERRR